MVCPKKIILSPAENISVGDFFVKEMRTERLSEKRQHSYTKIAPSLLPHLAIKYKNDTSIQHNKTGIPYSANSS